jgi:integrase
MKTKKKHIVPLSDRAIEILRSPDIGTEGFLFPGRWGEPMSNMTLSRLLKRMGYGGRSTIHGFRSSFRDWATEHDKCREVVAEAALAHVVKKKTEAAYRRATYLDERTTLMSRWAAHCG